MSSPCLHSGMVRLTFADATEAARMAASLAPDDDGFVAIRVDGAALVAEARSETPLGLLRTLDEVVATLIAARKAARAAVG